jgi:hypothetical protein
MVFFLMGSFLSLVNKTCVSLSGQRKPLRELGEHPIRRKPGDGLKPKISPMATPSVFFFLTKAK